MSNKIMFDQFREHVVLPTVEYLDLPFPERRVALLLGTAAHETGLKYLAQIRGPAMGPYQMEPATYWDLIRRIDNRLSNRPVYKKLLSLIPPYYSATRDVWPTPEQMARSAEWATAIAAMNYYMVPTMLPETLEGLADYWFEHWCRGCRGTREEWLARYRHYVRRFP